MDRRSLLLTPLVLAAGSAVAQTPAPDVATKRGLAWPEPVGTIDLWPKVTGQLRPDMKEVVEDVSTDPNIKVRRVQGISKPRIAIFPAANPNGGAMLIIPGGGFSWNYFDHEGYQLAAHFNRQGVTCFVLFYRLANDGWAGKPDLATADAQRAMRLIRANAARFKIDPKRVGVAGFSAGGFVTASLATRHAVRTYTPVDAVDELDARPLIAAPIYAVQSLDPAIAYSGTIPSLFGKAISPQQIARYSPDHNVDAHTPPCFMVHAEDDNTVPVANTTTFREVLKAKGIVVETHLFATGGHGFGMKPAPNEPYHLWPDLLVNFTRRQGLMA
ncbi:alpha/beta hydrolase [Asticcacaulis sp. 201]|uniref:alpha/beta hydrolase n=1 Tax=Asticcacaulis sp. 201 TaxID=3028787 RepID=UPI002916407D|nr:alpha/beta hydrolase [Asticcacaulis sp. 201]MDV6331942.1 alpha/beta hydrolase [Asticcacaulis sp. 201]